MRKTLLMTLSLMMCAGAAGADHIGISADEQGFHCDLRTLVLPPGTNTAYIIHKYNADGASASQFKVNDTTTLFATSQTTPFLSIGTWNTDLSIAYGGCRNGDVLLMTLNFLWFGTPIPPDCLRSLTVVPAPTTPIPGEIATVECDFNTLTPASGGALDVTTDGLPSMALAAGMYTSTASCVCASFCCLPLAAEESTWGRVKALYR